MKVCAPSKKFRALAHLALGWPLSGHVFLRFEQRKVKMKIRTSTVMNRWDKHEVGSLYGQPNSNYFSLSPWELVVPTQAHHRVGAPRKLRYPYKLKRNESADPQSQVLLSATTGGSP